MKHTSKEQLFFSRAYQSQQQLGSKNRSIVNFNHNAFLAFSALIIDHFITPPSRKLNAQAELILKNLDLLKVYPRYPAPETTPQHCLTSEHYLHQLCLAADHPTLLLWLTRSISLALKRLSFEEIAQNQAYYSFVLGTSIDLEKLQKEDINAFNPYVGLALQRILKFEFTQSETEDNKNLSKNAYPSRTKKTNTSFILHREKGSCLAGAIIEHADLFKAISTPEHTRFLCQELQQYQVTLPPSNPNGQTYQNRYAIAKKGLLERRFSLEDLKRLYIDVLDKLLTHEHQTPLFFWGKMKQNIPPLHSLETQNGLTSFSKRLHQELESTLCRLFALEIISDTVLLERCGLSHVIQDKTYLTQESDNSIMTFS